MCECKYLNESLQTFCWLKVNKYLRMKKWSHTRRRHQLRCLESFQWWQLTVDVLTQFSGHPPEVMPENSFWLVLTLFRVCVCPMRIRALEDMMERQKLMSMTERSDRMYLQENQTQERTLTRTEFNRTSSFHLKSFFLCEINALIIENDVFYILTCI